MAFLDASVLYPSLLRNILVRLAIDRLYRPFRSRKVQDEWTQALLRDRPHLPPAAIARTRQLMENAVKDAMVSGYETIIDGLVLPDANDRHVLAAAIHSGASLIVTANLRDFPKATLALHAIEAIHPDEFIFELFSSSKIKVLGTMRRLRQSLRKPPLSGTELLSMMRQQGLAQSANAFHHFVDVL